MSRGSNALSRRGRCRSVPCHNDLLAENYIDDGEQLWIVDFEYSGNNDPTFELGDTAQECGFDADLRARLCEAYFGEATPALLARMDLQAVMADVGWTLWAAIQARISSIDFDFWGWAEERWGRARAVLHRRGLRTAPRGFLALTAPARAHADGRADRGDAGGDRVRTIEGRRALRLGRHDGVRLPPRVRPRSLDRSARARAWTSSGSRARASCSCSTAADVTSPNRCTWTSPGYSANGSARRWNGNTFTPADRGQRAPSSRRRRRAPCP